MSSPKSFLFFVAPPFCTSLASKSLLLILHFSLFHFREDCAALSEPRRSLVSSTSHFRFFTIPCSATFLKDGFHPGNVHGKSSIPIFSPLWPEGESEPRALIGIFTLLPPPTSFRVMSRLLVRCETFSSTSSMGFSPLAWRRTSPSPLEGELSELRFDPRDFAGPEEPAEASRSSRWSPLSVRKVPLGFWVT